MTQVNPTDNQRRAITDLAGPMFVAAGAGSGKTGVLTHRFVHAICQGEAAVDEILTITFTKKAAAEMMQRIRELLHRRLTVDGQADAEQSERMAAAYREIERAQISTIDSFCASVLRTHALAAGLDPDFKAADETQAEVVREEAFDACLDRFVRVHGDDAVDLIAAYDPNRSGELYKIITAVYDKLRSQGRPAELPHVSAEEIPGSLSRARIRLAETVTRVKSEVEAGGITGAKIDKAAPTFPLLEEACREHDLSRCLELCKAGTAWGGGQFPGAVKPLFAGLKEAVTDYCDAMTSLEAVGTLRLLNELLKDFAACYQEEKQRRGLLDFGDLGIMSRDLLKANAGISAKVKRRYKFVMVDEFQDTNPLQHEIIELISDDNLFLVGDQNQAIYGFRDAEVRLFQEQYEAARERGCEESLATNFRSQPEILAFVDHVFQRPEMLGENYLQLEAGAGRDNKKDRRRIEVLFVDSDRDSKELGRKKLAKEVTVPAEAQFIAEHLRKLIGAGTYQPDEIAVLVRSSTDVDIYRDALSNAGIENYLAVGRSYFQKLELDDIVNMFRILVNPLDDFSLFAVLRSPLAGLSDDALYRLRQAAGRDESGRPLPIWPAAAGADIDGLRGEDLRRLRRFVGGFEELRELSGRANLQTIARQVIGFADYAAVAAVKGKRSLANLLKLVDLAADYETAWGSDLYNFTRFLTRQKDVKAKEAEAPTEEEDVRAVRIMTIHGAKGLEFPLVVLPRLNSRGVGNSYPAIILDREQGDRIGLKLKTSRGAAADAFDYGELKDDMVRRDRQEERRLIYVAMTRAKNHLILSGSAPADQPPSKRTADLPFDWIQEYLLLTWETGETPPAELIRNVNGIEVGIFVCNEAVAAARRFEEAVDSRKLVEPEPVGSDIVNMPPEPVYLPPSLSASAFDLYLSCPRRYYLQNVLPCEKIYQLEKGAGSSTVPAGASSGRWISDTDMGTLVHAILERNKLPLDPSVAASGEFIDRMVAGELPEAGQPTGSDRARAAALLANFSAAPTASRLAAAERAGELRKEFPFSTLQENVVINGKMDAVFPAQNSTVVVDYKTGSVEEGVSAAEAAKSYQYQMAAYALASNRLNGGPVEVVLMFLDRPGFEYSELYTVDDMEGLEKDLSGIIRNMASGTFAPLAQPEPKYCTLCAGGPNRMRLCPTGTMLGVPSGK